MRFWPFSWLFKKSSTSAPEPLDEDSIERSRQFRHDVVIPKISELTSRLNQLDQEAETDVGFFPENRPDVDRNPHPNH